MAQRQSLGPVQIHYLDLAGVNLGLRELSERLDELKGLRGRSEVYDRMRIDSPAELSDAIDLGSLEEREALFHVTFLAGGGAGIVAMPAGTSYVEVGEALRQRINFNTPINLEARMMVYAFGTETGTEKGVALTTAGGDVVSDVTWDGSGVDLYVGEFDEVDLDTDQVVQIRAKGSSSTESLILYAVAVEFRFASGAGVE